MAKWRLSAIQLTSTPSIQHNLNQVETYLSQLPTASQHLVVLPECFAIFGSRDSFNLQYQAALGEGSIMQGCAKLAKQFSVYLLAGSLPTTTDDPNRFAASSVLFAPDGTIVADYQKMHLFDVEVSDNIGSYRESATTKPGDKLVLAELQQLKLGLSICYDVRFPGLAQALTAKGMNVLSVPAAFTRTTGQAHWHTLLQARAIENQCFVIAANQTGVHENGRETFGHSLIIDPWGEILADAGTEPGWISSEIDLAQIARVRQGMPVASHNRFISELKP
ncbi:carbon-nitrogen hydrolase family protein [Rheinheimera sp. MMS21-TC3]|uniref:carbon-nitrogen hydrolase family protein n=1 Tax=Rheinheimera sp. MMS21-TC3 TaxID=3072790 RepID=UPI0028C4486A|nr:carbon-nitrogen hydrolase family protein [Rheinheimera sp. MMS21-TC3]WNO59915.1 carbon-nitrogen hydrolase family protein [Rheinheimera sp. MMS21-TC3]